MLIYPDPDLNNPASFPIQSHPIQRPANPSPHKSLLMLRTMHHALLPLILRNHAPFNRHVKHIDIRGGELARADVLLEEEIDLGEGSAAWFRDAEVGVDDAAEADPRPEEAGEVGPVPGAGVQHVGG
jgi:hypothetical protein